MHDLSAFIDAAERTVARCALGAPGAYRRHAGDSGETAPNAYGCADAANILYTIGRFPRGQAERAGWIAALGALQEPDTGLFHEATHHPIHTTAHCVAALELFDARPPHALRALAPHATAEGVGRFLDGLAWRDDPWRASHQGAGLYAALVLAGEVPLAWEDAYFDWLWREADPATGFWRQGAVAPVAHSGVATLFPHLAGSFHYLFNHEYARRQLRHPESMIDSCLELRAARGFPLAVRAGFAEIDWVYCVNRARRQSPHRAAECLAALTDFAADYVAFLQGPAAAADAGMADLHQLFGVLCAVAELQQALPGMIRTPRPLRLVLDRRPFI
jgi:hypothetical protein